MRHRKRAITLDRKRAARKALFRDLMTSLVLKGKIQTTLAKGRAIRPQIERLVTIAKRGKLHDRRKIQSSLRTSKAVNTILETLGPKYRSRPGGYTRMVKTKERKGDGAIMVHVEFV